MTDELAEIERIANDTADADLRQHHPGDGEERPHAVSRAATVFYNLLGADKNDAREKIDEKYSPMFAAHRDAIA